jgi:xylose dehydrogenase (NAD/NADP)
MAPAVHAASGAHLQAVASRSPERSTALDPLVVRADYGALLDDPDVDVVYVCLANDQHAEWVVKALDAGKHVLCEKPLGRSATEARLMAAAAERADRLLVEAVWTRWHPRFRRLAHLATSGALGAISSIESAFTFPGAIDGNYRADPSKGGGALLDVGGYQAHAWVALNRGASDVNIERATSSIGPTGVDLTTSVTALIDGTVRANALCSFEQDEAQRLIVQGSLDTAAMGAGQAFTSWREESTLLVGGGEESFAPVDAYQVMIEQVSARIRGEDSWVVPISETIRVAEILDDIRARACKP